MIKFNVPYISGLEEKYLHKAIEGKALAGAGEFNGLCTTLLAEKFAFEHCYLTPSCTAAIEMAALILDLKQNDEIIIPSFTFASCPNPFLMTGAKVVLADCAPEHPTLTLNELQPLVGENTKAVMLMHYGGCGLAVEEVAQYCKANKLVLIEDAAQCIGSVYRNKPLGGFGDLAVFSFHETKNVSCGEGGMLVVNNPALVDRAEIVQQYGTNRTAFRKGQADHYEWKNKGLALFQSELNTAFLYGNLQGIDEVNQQRKLIWERYHYALSNFSSNDTFDIPDIELFHSSNHHTFYLKIFHDKLDDFIDYMAKNGIQVAKHFYPLHLTSFPNSLPTGNYPNATKLQEQLVRLPMHCELSPEEIERTCSSVISFFTGE